MDEATIQIILWGVIAFGFMLGCGGGLYVWHFAYLSPSSGDRKPAAPRAGPAPVRRGPIMAFSAALLAACVGLILLSRPPAWLIALACVLGVDIPAGATFLTVVRRFQRVVREMRRRSQLTAGGGPDAGQDVNRT